MNVQQTKFKSGKKKVEEKNIVPVYHRSENKLKVIEGKYMCVGVCDYICLHMH